jgi:hypothetical protein
MRDPSRQVNQSSVTAPLELIADMCRGDLEAESKELEEMLSKGKRKHYRKPFFMVVDYTTQGHAYRDFIQNISPGGVFIETPMSFRIGQELSLTFALPSCQHHIKISGEVVRTSPQGIGVKFNIAKELGDYDLPEPP